MDPVGSQKKIASSEHNVSKQKNLDKKVGNLGGGFNKKSALNPSSKARDYDEWQGSVKGGTKHTYGVNGKNDPD